MHIYMQSLGCYKQFPGLRYGDLNVLACCYVTAKVLLDCFQGMFVF